MGRMLAPSHYCLVGPISIPYVPESKLYFKVCQENITLLWYMFDITCTVYAPMGKCISRFLDFSSRSWFTTMSNTSWPRGIPTRKAVSNHGFGALSPCRWQPPTSFGRNIMEPPWPLYMVAQWGMPQVFGMQCTGCFVWSRKKAFVKSLFNVPLVTAAPTLQLWQADHPNLKSTNVFIRPYYAPCI